MEKLSFTLHEDSDSFSKELHNFLKETFDSCINIDNTDFSDKYCKSRVDVYQIYSFLERGYITINVYLFETIIDNSLSVKVSVFSPINDTSRKCKKIARKIEQVIKRHG